MLKNQTVNAEKMLHEHLSLVRSISDILFRFNTQVTNDNDNTIVYYPYGLESPVLENHLVGLPQALY